MLLLFVWITFVLMLFGCEISCGVCAMLCGCVVHLVGVYVVLFS